MFNVGHAFQMRMFGFVKTEYSNISGKNSPKLKNEFWLL